MGTEVLLSLEFAKSFDFPVVNALQPSFGGGVRDAFVVKLSPTGDSLLSSTYLGGSADDMGNDIAIDPSNGSITVMGHTLSTDFPTIEPLQQHNAGGSDVFVTILSADISQRLYSTYLGGSEDEEGWGVAIAHSGETYVSGLVYSEDFPTVNAFQDTHGGGGV